MRTTLTLDEDVALLLERVRADRDVTFKELVNEALRAGLLQLQEPATSRNPYTTPGVYLGGCFLPSIDDIAEVLAFGEGEGFR